jgi:ribonuclease R
MLDASCMRSPKRAKEGLEQRLLRLLSHPRYQALDKTDLAKRLGVSLEDRAAFRRLLKDLEHRGKLARVRKDRYVLPQAADLLVGVLQANPQGFGYVLNETGDGAGDVFVAAENTSTAMNRDRVVVRISDEPALRSGRQRAQRQGEVIKILERANSRIVGTLQQSKKFHFVVPDDPALVHDIYVQLPAPVPQQPGLNDKVVVRFESWLNRHVNPEGEIIEVLGPARAPGVDILSIVKKYDLSTEFSPSVLEEAERIPTGLSPSVLRDREDLRQLPVFTIDPEDARDFDDAIHVVRRKQHWEVGIHIADVSHFVPSGSALDREAIRRGNSVYLPDRVIPMLPERLSNGVCSLRPAEDHLTKSVIVELDAHGRVISHRFAATVIRSQHRLTYEQAFERLERKPQDALDHDLQAAWHLASKLRARRFAQGALDLDMPDLRVKVDRHGRAVGLVPESNDRSHQLIEEFMLLANQLVAHATKTRQVPSVYRVHEDPDPAKLDEFQEFVRAHGITPGDLSQRTEMQKLLKKIAGRPDESVLKISLLRSLRKAIYVPEPLGHYGLAKPDYTHFTSPIRRYSDLLVHRAFNILLGSRSGKVRPPRSDRLVDLCDHISTTERTAADAEREAVKLKKLEYLESLIGRPHRLPAMVVDVRNYGLVVDIPAALLTGLIHVSSLDNDFFWFDAAQKRLIGRRTRASFGIGNRLEVGVVKVDRAKQQVDFKVLGKMSSSYRVASGRH